MAKRDRPAQEETLFDLPLTSAPADGLPPAVESNAPAEGESFPLFRKVEVPPLQSPATLEEPETESEVAPRKAGLPERRWKAGALDLAFHALVALVLLAGSWVLGAEISTALWAPFSLFLLSFSFLYFCLPLAFWGRTPGMRSQSLVARSPEGLPLTFGQCMLRWVASIPSLALLGTLNIFAPGGRTLSDRLSDSETLADAQEEKAA
jgi:uncharacterized RDD family membrane protein YckC